MQNANVTKDVVSTETQNLASIHLDAIQAPVNFITEDKNIPSVHPGQGKYSLVKD